MRRTTEKAVSNVYISPINPDPNTTGRYGSHEERAHRERPAPDGSPDDKSDRLEISRDARETYEMRSSGPDMDFARKALDKSPEMPEGRIAQILQRIEHGYYDLPRVLRSIVKALLSGLR